jgi:putative FmdB family regulatory protein
MPKFTFECKCGLNFTRNLKMGDHKTFECPSCHEEAARLWESFGFSFAPGGSAPANSGVTKHDYPNADQIVGSDADKRWQIYQEREKVKSTVRDVGGNRALVRKNGPDFIEYSAGSQRTIETRKGLATELSNILKRPPA